MVHNESDIIEPVVKHFLSEGVTGVIAVDHDSTDGTLGILNDLAARDRRIHVGRKMSKAFHQARSMSYIARLAFTAGADWIVPFDADEIWTAPSGTLADHLRCSASGVVRAQMFDAFPAEGTGRIDPSSDQYLQVEHQPGPMLKSAFKAQSWVWIGPGNHAVTHPGTVEVSLRIDHLPYRSYEQYCSKVLSGAAALEVSEGTPQEEGSHWREHASVAEEERQARWHEYVAGSRSLNFGSVHGERELIENPLWTKEA
ncbi:glycosyltransferase family 2 protein [Sinomonas sp. P10A9]|uniref:Glycosyltransferase family 2 protein n=1 Tax=Sinomonas puerhi TaxID=3238584 RepID=A0AB39L195_9MICC